MSREYAHRFAGRQFGNNNPLPRLLFNLTYAPVSMKILRSLAFNLDA